MVGSEKWQLLRDWMRELGIDEKELQEKFILGSGSGGQKLQKTSSCVQLYHFPSGIVVKCQRARFREVNRYFARYRLCLKIEALQDQQKSIQQQAIEKIRRQKKRRSRRQKQKMLDDKRRRSQVKQTRKKPESE